jgi:hypothetical protein
MTWARGMPALIRGRLMFEGGWFDLPAAACFNLYRPSARPAIPTRRHRQGHSLEPIKHTGRAWNFDVGLQTTANKPPLGAVGAAGHL